MKSHIHIPPLNGIRITDPLFGHYADMVAEKLIPYQWEILNDRVPGTEKSYCVANFRIAAGELDDVRQGAIFCDTDAYKWLETLAYCLEAGKAQEYEAVADEFIELIGRAQQPDGYLNTYFSVVCPDKKWTNLSEGHELYGAGHLIEAAAAYYKASGKKPGETGLIALDWINGVRSTLMDFDLSGLICGVTLETKPEDIYRALVEATAFGAWTIVNRLINEGVRINNVYASGGIPLKNPMLMQIYADVFNRDIFVVDDQHSAAVGSAILGLAASEKGGGFKNLGSIVEKFRREPEAVYHPVRENVSVYEKLFALYSRLYEEYGRKTDIMKQLKKIRDDAQ